MKYPDKERVLEADHEMICRWHRFLKSPKNSFELEILNLIEDKFKKLGGMTREISKKIGFNGE